MEYLSELPSVQALVEDVKRKLKADGLAIGELF